MIVNLPYLWMFLFFNNPVFILYDKEYSGLLTSFGEDEYVLDVRRKEKRRV